MRREKEPQYSKRALTEIIDLWIFVCKFGVLFEAAKLVVQLIQCPEAVTASLSDLYIYVGAPMTGGIIGYMIKSAMEEDKIRRYKQQRKAARDAKPPPTPKTVVGFSVTPVTENDESEG